jgi:acyl-CoA synthetase (AMP-forming)/AMP-acid ligase II
MSIAIARRTERPAGLEASTVAEGVQLTANANPDRRALRLKEDEFSISWAEYADKVRRTAAGRAGLGLGRGNAMGLMLTNRPEFHWFDAAALHLGATPFSIYNTYAPEQVHGEEALLAEVQRGVDAANESMTRWSRSRGSRSCPRSGSRGATSSRRR